MYNEIEIESSRQSTLQCPDLVSNYKNSALDLESLFDPNEPKYNYKNRQESNRHCP